MVGSRRGDFEVWDSQNGHFKQRNLILCETEIVLCCPSTPKTGPMPAPYRSRTPGCYGARARPGAARCAKMREKATPVFDVYFARPPWQDSHNSLWCCLAASIVPIPPLRSPKARPRKPPYRGLKPPGMLPAAP